MSKLFWIILIIILIIGGYFLYTQVFSDSDNDFKSIEKTVNSLSNDELIDSYYIDDNNDVLLEDVLE